MNGTSTVIHQINGAAVKALVPCPIFVKLYKHRMSGVDFIYQKLAAYGLKWKRKFKFYLKMSLKLTAIAIVNSDIVYKSLRILELRFVDLKIVVANLLIGCYTDCKRSFPGSHPRKRRLLEQSRPTEMPSQLPK